MENNLRKLMKTFERDPTVGSIVMDLLRRYYGSVGGMAPTGYRGRVAPIPRNSMENNLRKLVKTFQHDPTVGSIDTDLLSRYSGRVGVMAPTGHCRRVVPIPRNSMENILRKVLKQFEHDPTVGSIFTDLLSRYSGRVDGIARRTLSTCRTNSRQLYGK